VPEVIVSGTTGWICDTPQDLPQAVRDCRDLDPAACRAHVETKFSADKMALAYAGAYRRAILKSRTRREDALAGPMIST
jgi:hypothetical protein